MKPLPELVRRRRKSDVTRWWQIYVDDFDCPEILDAEQAIQVQGTPSAYQFRMREAYTHNAVERSKDRTV